MSDHANQLSRDFSQISFTGTSYSASYQHLPAPIKVENRNNDPTGTLENSENKRLASSDPNSLASHQEALNSRENNYGFFKQDTEDESFSYTGAMNDATATTDFLASSESIQSPKLEPFSKNVAFPPKFEQERDIDPSLLESNNFMKANLHGSNENLGMDYHKNNMRGQANSMNQLGSLSTNIPLQQNGGRYENMSQYCLDPSQMMTEDDKNRIYDEICYGHPHTAGRAYGNLFTGSRIQGSTQHHVYGYQQNSMFVGSNHYMNHGRFNSPDPGMRTSFQNNHGLILDTSHNHNGSDQVNGGESTFPTTQRARYNSFNGFHSFNSMMQSQSQGQSPIKRPSDAGYPAMPFGSSFGPSFGQGSFSSSRAQPQQAFPHLQGAPAFGPDGSRLPPPGAYNPPRAFNTAYPRLSPDSSGHLSSASSRDGSGFSQTFASVAPPAPRSQVTNNGEKRKKEEKGKKRGDGNSNKKKSHPAPVTAPRPPTTKKGEVRTSPRGRRGESTNFGGTGPNKFVTHQNFWALSRALEQRLIAGEDKLNIIRTQYLFPTWRYDDGLPFTPACFRAAKLQARKRYMLAVKAGVIVPVRQPPLQPQPGPGARRTSTRTTCTASETAATSQSVQTSQPAPGLRRNATRTAPVSQVYHNDNGDENNGADVEYYDLDATEDEYQDDQ